MRIDNISVRTVTTAIFLMVGVVAAVLSLYAGAYFRQAAMDAQIGSLSRVIEVAARQVLREAGQHAFDLGMKLAHNERLASGARRFATDGTDAGLVALLDDPFTSGFVGFSAVNLVQLRVYTTELELVAQSRAGLAGLEPHLPQYIAAQLARRTRTERLKAIDALWLSDSGPLYSTLVPVGGLRLAGYLEVIVDPAFNLQDIGDLTRTPISVLSATGESVDSPPEAASDQRLPVEYVLAASSGEPAFRIVGYEDVSRLSETMRRTQVVTTSGFLLLTLITLLSALWLFNRFFLRPLGRMVEGMGAIAAGELDLPVDKRGLKEFSELARSFESMASQVKIRTGDLERLLDLDDSAILCFGHAGEAVYFNKGAMALFGYADDEIGELELADLFRVDIARLVKNRRPPSDSNPENALSHTLDCVRKDGGVFRCEAVINPLDVMGGFGYTIVLSPVPETRRAPLASQVAMSMERNEQRMRAIEQSLNSILEIADNNPGLVQGGGQPQQSPGGGEAPVDDRQRLRVQAVEVMRHALTCWEHDLGRTKLALAEESRIWPVYIDKSTPTTRTLDKYLHTDSCPRNPRSQRVVDTAEFVLRSMDRKTTVCRKRLQQALDEYRRLLSGGARR